MDSISVWNQHDCYQYSHYYHNHNSLTQNVTGLHCKKRWNLVELFCHNKYLLYQYWFLNFHHIMLNNHTWNKDFITKVYLFRKGKVWNSFCVLQQFKIRNHLMTTWTKLWLWLTPSHWHFGEFPAASIYSRVPLKLVFLNKHST